MVMVGGVEIDVTLNLEGIEEALRELQTKVESNSIKIGVDQGRARQTGTKGKSSSNNSGNDREVASILKQHLSVLKNINTVATKASVSTNKCETLLNKQISILSKVLSNYDKALQSIESVEEEVSLFSEKRSESEKRIEKITEKSSEKVASQVKGVQTEITKSTTSTTNSFLQAADSTNNKLSQIGRSIDRAENGLSSVLRVSSQKNSSQIANQIRQGSSFNIVKELRSGIFQGVGSAYYREKKGSTQTQEIKSGLQIKMASMVDKVKENVLIGASSKVGIQSLVTDFDDYKNRAETFVEQSLKVMESSTFKEHYTEIESSLGDIAATAALAGQGAKESQQVISKAMESFQTSFNSVKEKSIKKIDATGDKRQKDITNQKVSDASSYLDKIVVATQKNDPALPAMFDEFNEKIKGVFADIESINGLEELDEDVLALLKEAESLSKTLAIRRGGITLALTNFEKKIKQTGDKFAESVSSTRRGNIKDTTDQIAEKKDSVSSFELKEGQNELVVVLPGFGVKDLKSVETSFQPLLNSATQGLVVKESPALLEEIDTNGKPAGKGLAYAHKMLGTDLLHYSDLTVETISQLIKTVEENPELKSVKFVGHSLGGAATREIIEASNEIDLEGLIREKLGRGVEIQGLSIGTATGKFARPSENTVSSDESKPSFQEVISRQDPVHRLFANEDSIMFRGGNTGKVAAGGLPGHGLEDYFADGTARNQTEDFLSSGSKITGAFDQSIDGVGKQIQKAIAQYVVAAEKDAVSRRDEEEGPKKEGEQVDTGAAVLDYTMNQLTKQVAKLGLKEKAIAGGAVVGYGAFQAANQASNRVRQPLKREEVLARHGDVIAETAEQIAYDETTNIEAILAKYPVSNAPIEKGLESLLEKIEPLVPKDIEEDIRKYLSQTLIDENKIIREEILKKARTLQEKVQEMSLQDEASFVNTESLTRDIWNLPKKKKDELRDIAVQLDIPSQQNKTKYIEAILKKSQKEISDAIVNVGKRTELKGQNKDYIVQLLHDQASEITTITNKLKDIPAGDEGQAIEVLEKAGRLAESIKNVKKEHLLDDTTSKKLNGYLLNLKGNTKSIRDKLPEEVLNRIDNPESSKVVLPGTLFEAVKEFTPPQELAPRITKQTKEKSIFDDQSDLEAIMKTRAVSPTAASDAEIAQMFARLNDVPDTGVRLDPVALEAALKRLSMELDGVEIQPAIAQMPTQESVQESVSVNPAIKERLDAATSVESHPSLDDDALLGEITDESLRKQQKEVEELLRKTAENMPSLEDDAEMDRLFQELANKPSVASPSVSITELETSLANLSSIKEDQLEEAITVETPSPVDDDALLLTDESFKRQQKEVEELLRKTSENASSSSDDAEMDRLFQELANKPSIANSSLSIAELEISLGTIPSTERDQLESAITVESPSLIDDDSLLLTDESFRKQQKQTEELLRKTAVSMSSLDDDAEMDRLFQELANKPSVANSSLSIAELEASLGDLSSIGPDILSGLENGIDLTAVNNLGATIGLEIKEGAEKSLGIQSPSKEFEEIGSQIVKGLNNGLSDLDSSEALINKKIEGLIDSANATVKKEIGSQKISDVVSGYKKEIGSQKKDSPRFSIIKDATKRLFDGQDLSGKITSTDVPVARAYREAVKEMEVNAKTMKVILSETGKDASLTSYAQNGLSDLEGFAKSIVDSLQGDIKLVEAVIEQRISKINDKINKGKSRLLGLDINKEQDKREIQKIDQLIDGLQKKLAELEDQKLLSDVNTGAIKDIEKIAEIFSIASEQSSFTSDDIESLIQLIDVLNSKTTTLGSDSIVSPDRFIRGQTIPGEETDENKELARSIGQTAVFAGVLLLVNKYKEAILSLGQASLQTAIEFGTLNNTINFLSGSAENGRKKIEELRNVASSTGSDFSTLLSSYNTLAASTRGGSLEGATTDNLVKGVALSAKTFGLSKEQAEGSLLAIGQIAGKGSVQMEELRGQLSERIPGAFQIAARSMKMTEKELGQLVATGQLTAGDFLPNFARQLNSEMGGGVSGAASSATASINKFNNSIQSLQTKIGGGLIPIHNLSLDVLSSAIDSISENMEEMGRVVLIAMSSLLVSTGFVLRKFSVFAVSFLEKIGVFQFLIRAIQMTKAAWIALGKAIITSLGKTAMSYVSIEIGIGILKQFQAEFGKSTVYDQWADNIESNTKRVNEAIKTSLGSTTALSQVKPSNQIASSGNWWTDMGENALGMVGMDKGSRLDRAVKDANIRREKEGKAPVSQQEIDQAIEAMYKIDRATIGSGAKQRDKAIIEREKFSRVRDEKFYNPIQRTMEQYKINKSGPLAEIEALEKKIKNLKAKQSVLDPSDVETAQQLTKEIGLAEKAKQNLLGPLDATESGLRQSLKDDQEKLDKYNQAIIDQTSDDSEKRKSAEEFLRKPGHEPKVMEQVARDIDQTTVALNNYQKEQARSGAFNDTKKLAMAMMELGFAFASVEKRINAIHIGKLKAIAQSQVKGFSSDIFNDTNTGLKTAEENYNNTQRLLKERKSTMARLQENLNLNPTKNASDELIKAEEERIGRKLTGEEVNMLADLYAKEGQEQLRQALTSEATLRDEKLRNLDLEKQSVEDIYAIRQARQSHYLAIYEDYVNKIKQMDQRNLSNAMTGANNQLARGLRSDLGAEDAFSVKTSGLQYISIQKQIDNNAWAMENLTQAYYEGKLSLEQYTTKSRALLTEDAQLKQQLVEQEISHIKLLSQTRMNALQRIKESRDANTSIANSNRNKGVTKNSIDDFRSDQFLSNNESLAKSKNALTEISHQLNNTKKELSELETEYATGEVLLNDYVQKKRQLLIAQAQEESQLADAQMAKMRSVEDYRLAMLDRARAVVENRNAINNASVLTQLAQDQMTGNMSDSEVSRVSAENTLNNARLAVEVSQEAITKTQQAYKKRELSAEKYHERLRQLNLEQAQNLQQVAEGELALWKAKEAEKISILEKSFEKQERLNKLNQMKIQIANKQTLINMTSSGGTSDLGSTIMGNQETNSQNDSQIKSIQKRLSGMKGVLNPTKDLQDKILATEQELNESVLNKRLTLLGQELDYKKQMLTTSQLENKAIDNQLAILEAKAKLEQAILEGQKKTLDARIAGMERARGLGDEIGAYSLKSIEMRAKMEDSISQTKMKSLDIQLKMNEANLRVEQQRDVLNQRKAENDSRMAVIQAKNSMLVAQGSGNQDAISLAQQQLQLANESLSTVAEQGALMNELHATQRENLEIEKKATLEAEGFARVLENINSKLKTANSYLDKQKERLDSINELNKAINSAKTNVLEKRAGIADKGIDLYDAINGTEKITDPKENPVLMKELQAQLKAIGGNTTDPKAMYAERLRLEESLANQKMNALVTEQNMQKTLLQIEFDKYELQAQALILQAKMLALQSKGTDNEASANQLLQDAIDGLGLLQERRGNAMKALDVNQSSERFNQGIENTNAINETRRRSAEAGYAPGGSPAKYPGSGEKEAGTSQRFGYTPSFDLNRAVQGLRGGDAGILKNIVPGKVNISNVPDTKEAKYEPLNYENGLLEYSADSTRANTKAVYDLSSKITELVNAITNPQQGTGQSFSATTPNNTSSPNGPSGPGGPTQDQQVNNTVNYGGVTIISSDPTGDARKVLTDLAKANKNRF